MRRRSREEDTTESPRASAATPPRPFVKTSSTEEETEKGSSRWTQRLEVLDLDARMADDCKSYRDKSAGLEDVRDFSSGRLPRKQGKQSGIVHCEFLDDLATCPRVLGIHSSPLEVKNLDKTNSDKIVPNENINALQRESQGKKEAPTKNKSNRNPSKSLPSLLDGASLIPGMRKSTRRRLSLNLKPVPKSSDDLKFPPPSTAEFWHRMRRESISLSNDKVCRDTYSGGLKNATNGGAKEYSELSYSELIITWVRQTQTVL